MFTLGRVIPPTLFLFDKTFQIPTSFALPYKHCLSICINFSLNKKSILANQLGSTANISNLRLQNIKERERERVCWCGCSSQGCIDLLFLISVYAQTVFYYFFNQWLYNVNCNLFPQFAAWHLTGIYKCD